MRDATLTDSVTAAIGQRPSRVVEHDNGDTELRYAYRDVDDPEAVYDAAERYASEHNVPAGTSVFATIRESRDRRDNYVAVHIVTESE